MKRTDSDEPNTREAIVIGGGVTDLSAAIYLGGAQRDVLVIDSGHSMAKWEPVVENYLGFPRGVGGEELLRNGCAQARKHDVRFVRDNVRTVSGRYSGFASVPRPYAAGCVTPANCEMIIAAGQGAAAAQAINRDSFEESLATHTLRRFRAAQLEEEKTVPEVLKTNWKGRKK